VGENRSVERARSDAKGKVGGEEIMMELENWTGERDLFDI
jgi:hypothetical protein